MCEEGGYWKGFQSGFSHLVLHSGPQDRAWRNGILDCLGLEG